MDLTFEIKQLYFRYWQKKKKIVIFHVTKVLFIDTINFR